MNDLPLWATQDQLDRLQSKLEQMGFISVGFEREDDELIVTAKRYRQDTFARVAGPDELSGVVERFKNWNKHNKPGDDAYDG